MRKMNNIKITKYTLILGLLSFFTVASAKSVLIEFKVDGQCGECKERIEAALDQPGINYAVWEVESKMLKVKYNTKKYSEDDIHKIISDLGYATSKMKANLTSQEGLPKCCQPGGH